MAKRVRKRKCKNCPDFFSPDPCNAWHQEYCRKSECRKASKAASQKRWLEKKENQDYFRGSENVQRVKEWRKKHPGYWRRKHSVIEERELSVEEPVESRKTSLGPVQTEPLQDLSIEKSSENHSVVQPLPAPALQDLLSSQPAVLIGLIALFTGTALQDDIATTTLRLQQLGNDILNRSTQNKGGSDDPKVSHLPTAYPKGPQPVQLGGSPSGP